MDTIAANRFVLLDESGRQAATLSVSNDGAVLRFIDRSNQTTAITLGVENSKKFLEFYSKKDIKVMELNSIPPSGSSTLHLGDERVQGRASIGVSASEDLDGDFTDNWHIQLRNPRNTLESLFRVDTVIDISTQEAMAVLRLNNTRKLRFAENTAADKEE